jgi:hypothetical protein
MNLPALPAAPASPEQWTELFLSRLDGGLMLFRQASHLLIAYSAWPNDQKLRDRYMAANLGLEVAHLERRLILTATSGTVSANVMPERLSGRSALELFGGWEAVAEAASSSVLDTLEKIQREWPRVADIFHTIIDIAHEKRIEVRGGPSISKAIDLVEDAQQLPGRSQLTAVWSSFRDVAHVITASAYLAHCALKAEDPGAILSAMLLAPDIVVPLAGAFQQFGLATKPHGRDVPILNPETLWRIPDAHLPQNLFLPVRTLTQRQLELLETRKARKKYKAFP